MMDTHGSPTPCEHTPGDETAREPAPTRARCFGPERTLTRLTVGEPLGIIRSGERVRVRLRNAIGADAGADEDLDRFMQTSDYKRFGHQYTGPIQVECVPRNASLTVHVRCIEVFNSLSCISSSTGLLKGEFSGRQSMVSPSAGQIVRLRDVAVRSAPSIGGIATLDEEARSPGRCSAFGGNLDLPMLAAGCKIHLPVRRTPVQFAVGDLHFRQGCGESSGMGLEAEGEIELDVCGSEPYGYPVLETPSTLAIVGWGESLDAAMKLAVRNALDYLCRRPPFSSWSPGHVYQLLGGFDLVLGNATGRVATCAQTFSREALLDPASGRSVALPPQRLERDASPALEAAPSGLSTTAEAERAWGPLLAAQIERYEALPVYHVGDSREIRGVPEHEELLVARLLPNVYSWSAGGVLEVPGSADVRARINARLCEVLHRAGIPTSTLATSNEYVLMRRQPVASHIEVVVKTSFRGSPKHRYRDFATAAQRRGGAVSAGAPHRPYVRFDWRNPKGKEDEVLPEALADQFIDVVAARDTVLRAHKALNAFLRQRELEVVDGCFFLSDDGRVVCGEVSVDNLTLQYLGVHAALRELLGGRTKSQVLERWAAIDELIQLEPRVPAERQSLAAPPQPRPLRNGKPVALDHAALQLRAEEEAHGLPRGVDGVEAIVRPNL
jgi:acetamidase/formamidase